MISSHCPTSFDYIRRASDNLNQSCPFRKHTTKIHNMTSQWAQLVAAQNARNAAMASNPISYIPASMRQEIREKTVLKVFVVCDSITPRSGDGTTNHWTFAFDVDNGQSVRLDVQPDYNQRQPNGSMKSSVIVSWLADYVVPECAERADPVSVTRSRSLGWYIDCLQDGGRFKYMFTAEGVGCRQWITDTLHLMADAGEFDGEECLQARNAISHTWPSGTLSPPTPGTYFH